MSRARRASQCWCRDLGLDDAFSWSAMSPDIIKEYNSYREQWTA
jgi:hypothetical protein